jgi:predicted metallopeptidase
MAIRYVKADDIKEEAERIVSALGWNHILLDSVAFLRSFGSTSRRTIARCHALGKAMQIGMGRDKSFYLIEVISEKFDKQSEEEKVKTIIHELMHIPFTFGGGFKHHHIVNERSVEKEYKRYLKLKGVEGWF